MALPTLVFGVEAEAVGGETTSVDRFANALDTPEAPPDLGPPPEDPDAAAEYHAMRPGPNYSEFQAEMVDQYGREYTVARMGSFLDSQDDVDNKEYTTPDGSTSRSFGRLLLFARLPINHRGMVPLPEPDGEKLQLFVVGTQVLCSATTDGAFFMPRAKTGHIFVTNFQEGKKVVNPAPYMKWVEGGAREPGGERF